MNNASSLFTATGDYKKASKATNFGYLNELTLSNDKSGLYRSFSQFTIIVSAEAMCPGLVYCHGNGDANLASVLHPIYHEQIC